MKETSARKALLDGLFTNNPTFIQMLGMCPTLAITTAISNALRMGLATTAVLVCSNALISMLRRIIPKEIRIAAYIVMISGFVTAVELLMKAYVRGLYETLGIYIPLIVVNCIILARAESFASKNKMLPSIMDGIGCGLGFTGAIMIIATVREILGNGTFFGMPVPVINRAPAQIFVSSAGAFLTLGFLLALIQWLRGKKRQSRTQQQTENNQIETESTSLSAPFRETETGHTTSGEKSDQRKSEEIDVSAPLKGQALVKLLRAVVNPSDLGMIGGSYGRLRQLPAIGGREGIGEVVEIGAGVENVKVGTRVRIPEEPGVWTQYQICDASNLMVVPNDISEDLEAMSFINPPTAYCILNQFTDLKEGDWVIQNGASSALGRFMIQMCHARGIKTVNMLRNAEERSAELKAYGADIVVDESQFDPKSIKAETSGKLRLGLNQIGGESVSNMIKAVGDSATIVTVGGMVGTPIRFPTRFLIFNDLRLRGFWWDKWQRTHTKQEVKSIFDAVFDLERKGILKAPIDSEFELKDIKQAMERAVQNSRGGKVLIKF